MPRLRASPCDPSRRPALLAGLLALFALLPGRPAAAALRPDFVELVRRYARGERAAAVGALQSWSERDLERQLDGVQSALATARRCPRCPEARLVATLPLKAAVLLHADRDDAERPLLLDAEQPRRCPGRAMELAGEYAGLLAQKPEAEGFARRFFLVVALRCQWDYCLADAIRWAQRGSKLFPRDAPLLLAHASTLEEGATVGVWTTTLTLVPGASPWQRHLEVSSSAARDKKRDLQQASRLLAEATAADPTLALAHLRLGRVLWRLGEADRARASLEEALRQTDAAAPLVEPPPGAEPANVAFLAHLFLGRVHEDAERLEAALAEYRAAVAIDPRAQSAAVALSHALRLAGDEAGSRQALARGLAAFRADARDAYREYLVSNALGHEALLRELRAESLE